MGERDEEKPKDRLYRCYWCGAWVCGTFQANAFRAWGHMACLGCFRRMLRN